MYEDYFLDSLSEERKLDGYYDEYEVTEEEPKGKWDYEDPDWVTEEDYE